MLINPLQDTVLVLVVCMALVKKLLRQQTELSVLGELGGAINILVPRLVSCSDLQDNVGDGELSGEGGDVTIEDREDTLTSIV
jgi:hypothetical protein